LCKHVSTDKIHIFPTILSENAFLEEFQSSFISFFQSKKMMDASLYSKTFDLK